MALEWDDHPAGARQHVTTDAHSDPENEAVKLGEGPNPWEIPSNPKLLRNESILSDEDEQFLRELADEVPPPLPPRRTIISDDGEETDLQAESGNIPLPMSPPVERTVEEVTSIPNVGSGKPKGRWSYYSFIPSMTPSSFNLQMPQLPQIPQMPQMPPMAQILGRSKPPKVCMQVMQLASHSLIGFVCSSQQQHPSRPQYHSWPNPRSQPRIQTSIRWRLMSEMRRAQTSRHLPRFQKRVETCTTYSTRLISRPSTTVSSASRKSLNSY